MTRKISKKRMDALLKETIENALPLYKGVTLQCKFVQTIEEAKTWAEEQDVKEFYFYENREGYITVMY